jgi:catalase (peroxidase I)
MKQDPLYEKVSSKFRQMNQSQLQLEGSRAQEALMQLGLARLYEPGYEDSETLSAEERWLDIQPALNLKARDAAIEEQISKEKERTGGSISPEAEEALRSVADRMFGKDIDRLQSQLSCREKLARLSGT